MEALLVPLEPRHAVIIPHLRAADVEEIYAMTGLPPRLAVAFSIVDSKPGWAVELNGAPVAVFGVGAPPLSRSIGRPWLVGTDELAKYPVHFYRLSKKVVNEMKARYAKLENYVDARNKLSIRWLEWSGFHIEKAENIGFENREFHRFWWEA